MTTIIVISFENFATCGELVTVSETCNRSNNHTYPQPVKTVLAGTLVATSLLTATLKFAGDITVQPRRMPLPGGDQWQ